MDTSRGSSFSRKSLREMVDAELTSSRDAEHTGLSVMGARRSLEVDQTAAKILKPSSAWGEKRWLAADTLSTPISSPAGN